MGAGQQQHRRSLGNELLGKTLSWSLYFYCKENISIGLCVITLQMFNYIFLLVLYVRPNFADPTA